MFHIKKQGVFMKSLIGIFVLLMFIHGTGVMAADTMYTQFGMWYDKGKSYTSTKRIENKNVQHDIFSEQPETKYYATDLAINGTNFGRGTFLPVNSEVKIIIIDNNKIFLQFEEKIIMLFNREEYTTLSNAQFLEKCLKKEKVDLSPFSAEDQSNISIGRVKKGMSKKAVLLARGYPPAHKTPDLAVNRWQYWEESTHSHYYYFEDDKFDGKD